MTDSESSTPVLLVWNGCDGYIEVETAVRQGYRFTEDGKLCHKASSFAPFYALELDPATLPIDDGEIIMDGVLGGENGKFYQFHDAKV